MRRQLMGAGNRGPKEDINIRILPNSISGIPFYWALEPECEILMSMWSFGPLRKFAIVVELRCEVV